MIDGRFYKNCWLSVLTFYEFTTVFQQSLKDDIVRVNTIGPTYLLSKNYFVKKN